jgi:hypothetical protein
MKHDSKVQDINNKTTTTQAGQATQTKPSGISVDGLRFVVEHGVTLVKVDSQWKLNFIKPLEGFEVNRTYPSAEDAIQALYDHMQRPDVIKKVA